MSNLSPAPPITTCPISPSRRFPQALKRHVEQAFGFVRVRGEISGFKRAPSGHLYLSLKDETAVLTGVCWRGTASRLSLNPEDGMEVVATGRLTTYPGRSQYQIVVESMELAGEGALLKLLEDRKKRLAAEGLFDAERKKPLPYLPAVIGVVTSPTGAVIQDILHRLRRPLPAPRADLAGAGAGRRGGRTGGRRHPGLRRPAARRRRAAAGRADRRARRRQPRGPLGVQRGSRRPRRGRLRHPADIGGRATRPTPR